LRNTIFFFLWYTPWLSGTPLCYIIIDILWTTADEKHDLNSNYSFYYKSFGVRIIFYYYYNYWQRLWLFTYIELQNEILETSQITWPSEKITKTQTLSVGLSEYRKFWDSTGAMSRKITLIEHETAFGDDSDGLIDRNE